VNGPLPGVAFDKGPRCAEFVAGTDHSQIVPEKCALMPRSARVVPMSEQPAYDRVAVNQVARAACDHVRVDDMTADDYESVERASRVLYERGWHKRFSVNEMTSAWRALVAEVEAGYDQMVDEYTNDLACRDWLAFAWPMFTERVRSSRQSELDALGARFRAATTEDTDGKLARFYRVESKAGWWWRRLPTCREGQFARDLDA
jgi:hypothetical protein